MPAIPSARCGPRNPGPLSSATELSPTQSDVVARLERAVRERHLVVLQCGQALGRTTIMEALHARIGGALLRARDLLAAVAKRHPLAIEEGLDAAIGAAIDRAPHALVDDLHLVLDVVRSCGPYPRSPLVEAVLVAWAQRLEREGKHLVIALDECRSSTVHALGHPIRMTELTRDDYAHLIGLFAGRSLPRASTSARCFACFPAWTSARSSGPRGRSAGASSPSG